MGLAKSTKSHSKSFSVDFFKLFYEAFVEAFVSPEPLQGRLKLLLDSKRDTKIHSCVCVVCVVVYNVLLRATPLANHRLLSFLHVVPSTSRVQCHMKR